MVRPKSKVDMLKPVEALQHQSARNQKSHRDRNLRDDENIQPSAPRRASADSLIALLKTRHHVAFAGAFQCRNQSEDHAGRERYEEGKTQYASVNFEIEKEAGERSTLDRIHRGEDRHDPMREQQTAHAAEHRQQHAFGEKLPDQSPSACAQPTPQCEFACARNAARELKIRYVCATNEQQKRNTSHKREKRFANVAGQVAEQFLPYEITLTVHPRRNCGY